MMDKLGMGSRTHRTGSNFFLSRAKLFTKFGKVTNFQNEDQKKDPYPGKLVIELWNVLNCILRVEVPHLLLEASTRLCSPTNRLLFVIFALYRSTLLEQQPLAFGTLQESFLCLKLLSNYIMQVLEGISVSHFVVNEQIVTEFFGVSVSSYYISVPLYSPLKIFNWQSFLSFRLQYKRLFRGTSFNNEIEGL